MVEESFFSIDYKVFKFKKETRNDKQGDVRYHGYGHVMREEEDESFTVYPLRSGTPYIFEPVRTTDLQNLSDKL